MLNPIQKKQYRCEVMADVYSTLESKINSLKHDYRVVGKKDVQRKDWRTGELLWKDDEHTIPVYEDEWDNVEFTPEELKENGNAERITILEDMMKSLEKMI